MTSNPVRGPGIHHHGVEHEGRQLAEGDLVVAKAGTFLRDGDAVRPVKPDALMSGKLTEAGP